MRFLLAFALLVCALESRAQVKTSSDGVFAAASVSYQLGDESLDGVCTSLDGPRCNPADKMEFLSRERSKMMSQKDNVGNTRRTVSEYVFHGGKEISSKHNLDPDHREKQRKAKATASLAKAGARVDKSTSRGGASHESSGETGRKGGGGPELDADGPDEMSEVELCGKGKIGQGVCRSGVSLYRCTKSEGNPLFGSKATPSCLGIVESDASCLPGEMLCPVDSPASLSEFSSPEPCVYEYKRGFVPDDARQDILIKEMTWPQAKAFCDRNDECAAFTFESVDPKPKKPVTIWFKRISYTDSGGRGWHTFVKKCPQPPKNRFAYLDSLDRSTLEWLHGELQAQMSYVASLHSKKAAETSGLGGASHGATAKSLTASGAVRDIIEVDLVDDRGNSFSTNMVSSANQLAAMMKKAAREQGHDLKADEHYQEVASKLWNNLFDKAAASSGQVDRPLQVKSRVAARWKGGHYYPGEIAKVHKDGSFAVQFDDGDYQEVVLSKDVLSEISHVMSTGEGNEEISVFAEEVRRGSKKK